MGEGAKGEMLLVSAVTPLVNKTPVGENALVIGENEND
jgi:hypothetical protein